MIRPAQPDDLPALTAIYNHYVRASVATFDLEAFTPEARRAWFDHYRPTGPHRLLVADRGAGPVGYATSSPFNPKGAYRTSIETSVYLHPDHRGSGLGGALYAALFDALAGEDLHRAYAGITLPHPASVALHERMGFRQVGLYREVGRKFDRWWDVAWFEKPLG